MEGTDDCHFYRRHTGLSLLLKAQGTVMSTEDTEDCHFYGRHTGLSLLKNKHRGVTSDTTNQT